MICILKRCLIFSFILVLLIPVFAFSFTVSASASGGSQADTVNAFCEMYNIPDFYQMYLDHKLSYSSVKYIVYQTYNGDWYLSFNAQPILDVNFKISNMGDYFLFSYKFVLISNTSRDKVYKLNIHDNTWENISLTNIPYINDNVSIDFTADDIIPYLLDRVDSHSYLFPVLGITNFEPRTTSNNHVYSFPCSLTLTPYNNEPFSLIPSCQYFFDNSMFFEFFASGYAYFSLSSIQYVDTWNPYSVTDFTYDMMSYRPVSSEGDKVINIPTYDTSFFDDSNSIKYTQVLSNYTNGHMSIVSNPTYQKYHIATININPLNPGVDESVWSDFLDNVSVTVQYKETDGSFSDEFPKSFPFGLFTPRNNVTFMDLEFDDGNTYKNLMFHWEKTPLDWVIKLNWYFNDNLIRSDDWTFRQFSGVVDTNNDGIDDRTQQKDDDGNIISDGTGIPTDHTTDLQNVASADLSSLLTSIRPFFSSLYGIIPPELLSVIIGGLVLLVSVGIIRVVL